jgi:uncharacterized protein
VGVSPAETALLAVLMLRGPQTLGELRQRTERLHRFESADETALTLDGLVERALVARLPRRPGQKEERFAHLLGGEGSEEVAEEPAAPPGRLDALEERVLRLEDEVASLRRELGS